MRHPETPNQHIYQLTQNSHALLGRALGRGIGWPAQSAAALRCARARSLQPIGGTKPVHKTAHARLEDMARCVSADDSCVALFKFGGACTCHVCHPRPVHHVVHWSRVDWCVQHGRTSVQARLPPQRHGQMCVCVCVCVWVVGAGRDRRRGRACRAAQSLPSQHGRGAHSESFY